MKLLFIHGESDDQVRFEGGVLARDLLLRHGYDVAWLPFAGGHDVPDEVIDPLRSFINGA